MLEITARIARPMAASHAANTRITMGKENIIMDWELSDEKDVRIKRHSIIPSRHRRVDIR